MASAKRPHAPHPADRQTPERVVPGRLRCQQIATAGFSNFALPARKFLESLAHTSHSVFLSFLLSHGIEASSWPSDPCKTRPTHRHTGTTPCSGLPTTARLIYPIIDHRCLADGKGNSIIRSSRVCVCEGGSAYREHARSPKTSERTSSDASGQQPGKLVQSLASRDVTMAGDFLVG